MKRISLALPTFPNPSAVKPQIALDWLSMECAKLSVSVRLCAIAEANAIANVERVTLARLKKSLSFGKTDHFPHSVTHFWNLAGEVSRACDPWSS